MKKFARDQWRVLESFNTGPSFKGINLEIRKYLWLIVSEGAQEIKIIAYVSKGHREVTEMSYLMWSLGA